MASDFTVSLAKAKQFTARSTLTHGSVASTNDALAANFLRPPRVATGRVVRDGDRWYVSLDEDAVTSRERADPNPPTKPFPGKPGVRIGTRGYSFTTYRTTVDGLKGIQFSPQSESGSQNNVNLTATGHALEVAHFIYRALPIDGKTGLAALATGAAAGTVKYSDLHTDADGLLRVTFEVPDRPLRISYTLDPRRGHFPVRWETRRPDGTGGVTVVPEVAACGDGWFPTRLVSAGTQKGWTDYTMWEHRLLDFDPAARPTEADFRIDLPAGTTVLRADQGDDRPPPFFRTKQPETVGPEDYDRLCELCDAATRERDAVFAGTSDPQAPRPDTAVHPPSVVPGWAWWAGGAGALAAGLVGRRRAGRVA